MEYDDKKFCKEIRENIYRKPSLKERLKNAGVAASVLGTVAGAVGGPLYISGEGWKHNIPDFSKNKTEIKAEKKTNDFVQPVDSANAMRKVTFTPNSKFYSEDSNADKSKRKKILATLGAVLPGVFPALASAAIAKGAAKAANSEETSDMLPKEDKKEILVESKANKEDELGPWEVKNFSDTNSTTEFKFYC